MQYCPNCKTEQPEYTRFCAHCGFMLEETIKCKRVTNPPVVDGQPDSPSGIRISTVSSAFGRGEAAKEGDARFPLPSLREMNGQEVENREASLPPILATSARVAPKGHIAFLHGMPGNLPLPVRRVIAMVLTQARDSKPEVSSSNQTSGQNVAGSGALAWGWLSMLALTSALGTFSVAYAYTSARNNANGAENFYWLGLLLIFVPSVVRLISPVASRFERISILCIVGICFFSVFVMYNPLSFSPHDAFTHWRTADDIARSGHLFSENSLLPVSPFYPGLEIVTNALSALSGLNIFYSGLIILCAARILVVFSLFMLYEQVTKSARIAGIATLIYMTNPHFLFFDTDFTYESLALPLATLLLFVMARYEILKSDHRRITLIAWILLGAITVTHHMTDFVFDGLLILLAVIYLFQRSAPKHRSNLVKIALFGVFTSIAWISLKGNPVTEYLSSYYGSALSELGHILTGTSSARHFFADYSAGQPTPLWQRLMAISSLGLILLCLPLGLLCLWQRYRYSGLACMLGIASLIYPISQVFRLTNFGSEITDRAAAFLFIPIACILAIFIAQFWPTRWLSWKQTLLITCATSVLFLGGLALPAWQLLPGPYLITADQRSIEPEGVQSAIWAYSYLGPNNRIATDRINRLLMNTYGDQRPVTVSEDGIDVSSIFFSPTFGTNEEAILKDAKVRYLVVDLRLSKGLPTLGFYFEPGEPDAFMRTTPINLKALTKFNTISQINRVFDSGDIVIYDVGALAAGS